MQGNVRMHRKSTTSLLIYIEETRAVGDDMLADAPLRHFQSEGRSIAR